MYAYLLIFLKQLSSIIAERQVPVYAALSFHRDGFPIAYLDIPGPKADDIRYPITYKGSALFRPFVRLLDDFLSFFGDKNSRYFTPFINRV